MAELPQNWIETELVNITNLYTGNSINESVKKEKYTNLSEGFNYIATKDIGYDKSINYKNGIKIPFEETSFKIALKGSVLLCIEGGSAGRKLAFTNEDVCFVNKLCAFVSKISTEHAKFIYYYFQSNDFKAIFNENKNGLIGGVSLNKLKQIKIIQPPLNEQKRIVEKLDKIIRIVDGVNARLDKIPTALKRARQSILNQAITGELTKDWRENRGLNMSWENVILIDLLQEKPRNGYSPISVNYDTGIKNLTLTATTSGVFKKEYYKFVDIKIDKNSHLWLSDGDILIQRSNSIDYVGTAAIYHGNQFEYIYPDLMMKLKVNERVSNEYLYLCLSSINVKNYFRNNATGTAGNMPKINQKVVSNTPITLPPKEEQTEIVRRVKLAFEKLDKIESRYQKAKEYSDKLTQSILNKAFRGELVPQDPNDKPIKIPE